MVSPESGGSRRSFLQIKSGRVDADYRRALAKGTKAGVMDQIMRGRPDIFTRQASEKKLIGKRLGWVNIASRMKKEVGAIEQFGQKVLASGIKHVVLLGMGGSSLGPNTLKRMMGRGSRSESFHVLDSTDPTAIRAIKSRIDLKTSLFIVSSKSGTTVETRSLEAYFAEQLERSGVRQTGRHFVAITDKGSPLEKFARKRRYRKIFFGPANIGGRFSVLSHFGLVPGFFAGVDIAALLDDAIAMEKLLNEREGEANPALALGSLLAAAATAGKNKLTFVASFGIEPLIPWIEQLVAESTGKRGKGIIPVDNEPIGDAGDYGSDRMFAFFVITGDRTVKARRERVAFERKGFPTVSFSLTSVTELGGQFLLWEAATAVAGYHLGINPFDEPNVTESKENTKAILAAFERSGAFPDQKVHGKWGKLSLVAYEGKIKYSVADMANFKRFLKRFFNRSRPPKFVSLLNFFQSNRGTEGALDQIRMIIRDKTGMATIRGYGPRYLHSIGQLYKGGPQDGIFVVFVKASYGRLEVPGQVFSFGQLIAAQAIGDVQALVKRRRPILVVAVDGRPAGGLEEFATVLRDALK